LPPRRPASERTPHRSRSVRRPGRSGPSPEPGRPAPGLPALPRVTSGWSGGPGRWMAPAGSGRLLYPIRPAWPGRLGAVAVVSRSSGRPNGAGYMSWLRPASFPCPT
jgi:hypothetical protein